MTEFELLNQRVVQMSINAVKMAESNKGTLEAVSDVNDRISKVTEKVISIGEDVVVALKLLNNEIIALKLRLEMLEM